MYKLFFLALVSSFNGLLFAQSSPSIEWQRSLGGSEADFASSIRQTSDGGYIAAGGVSSNNGDVLGYQGGIRDAWVVKLGADGTIQWQRPFGGPGMDNASAIEQTNDGGYIVAGGADEDGGDVSGNHGSVDFWVLKLDADGNLEWQRSLGGSDSENASSVQQTADGGYIIAGQTRSNDGDVSGNLPGVGAWVVKIDGGGNIEWQKCLGGSGFDSANDIKQTTDGGYIFCGSSSSSDGDVTNNHGGIDYWVVRLDEMGNIQWQRSLGGSSIDEAYAISATMDGGYIVAGETSSDDGDVSGNHGFVDYWIVKLDSTGSIQWQECYGGSSLESAHAVEQLDDGGYIVTGWAQSEDGQVTGYHGGSSGDAWLIRLDVNGALLWQKALGGSATDRAVSLQQCSDQGFVLAGFSSSNDGDVTGNHGASDFWIVKLGPDDVGISELGTKAPFSLYPNPSTDQVHIHFDQQTPTAVQLQLFNAEGRLIETILETMVLTAERTLHYSTVALPAGLYELRLIAGRRSFSRRMVKM